MDYEIFDCSVVGYKNISKGHKSQDYLSYKIIDNSIISTVADGHSSDFFTYSDEGSKIACNVAISVLKDYINKPLSFVTDKLNDKTIQREIQNKWMDGVSKHCKSINPVVFNIQYLKYSTTLLACLISKEFRLYLKIGDGEIIKKDKKGYKSIINTNDKDIVDSLGRDNSYENIMCHIEPNNYENKADAIIMFTDGYENSFENEDILFESLDKTIKQYNESVFSRWILMKYYKSYLSKMSKKTTLDDISIIYLF